MPRTHALQARSGQARPVAVRFTDDQLASVSALADRSSVSPSTLIRAAVQHDVLTRSPETVSAFWPTYAATLEHLHIAGVRPVIVGLWAAIAHGYVVTAPRMQLLVSSAEAPRLSTFLESRGARHRDGPVVVGHEPWAVEFLSAWGTYKRVTSDVVRCGRIDVAVATLEDVLENIDQLPVWSHDDLLALRDGRYRNDDGTRGEAAWDYAGRMNASSVHGTERGGAANFFVDFRRTARLKAKSPR
jgi:hypothetical protein